MTNDVKFVFKINPVIRIIILLVFVKWIDFKYKFYVICHSFFSSSFAALPLSATLQTPSLQSVAEVDRTSGMPISSNVYTLPSGCANLMQSFPVSAMYRP